MEHRLLNLDSRNTLNTSLPHLLLIWYSPPMPSTNSTDMTQFTSVPVLVLLIWYSLQLPSTSPTDTIANLYTSVTPTYMIQSTTAQILDLWYDSRLLQQYQSDWYPTVYYCPSFSPVDTQQSTTAPVPVLLIRHMSLLPQYQSYWYATVHLWPSTNLITSPSTTAPVPILTNILQSPTVPVTVLIIRHSTILP